MAGEFQVAGGNQKAPFTLKIHRGDGMALLAMNWKEATPPDDFVGFAIEYREPNGDRFYPLKNRLSFPTSGGQLNPNQLSTLESPIQKFRWVHFPRNADLDGRFTYRVKPVFMASDGALSYGAAQTVAIELRRDTYPGVLNVAFTRGFVASQRSSTTTNRPDRSPSSTSAPEAGHPGRRSRTGTADRGAGCAAADLRAPPAGPRGRLDGGVAAGRGRVLVGWHRMSTDVQSGPVQAERQWWMRLVHVLTTPASVFVWVRDDSAEAAAARQEPLTALVFASGISIFLATSTAGRFFDDFENNNSYLLLFMECIVAGLLVAIQNFWIVGAAVYLGGRTADSAATYRQARHVVALATAPFVVELLFVWPVRLVMFGGDSFRAGGSDHGVRESVFRALDSGFLAWSLVLLVVGVRTLNGWQWPRTFASLVIAGVLLALITLLFVGVQFG